MNDEMNELVDDELLAAPDELSTQYVTNYVVGFAFTRHADKVLLIRKEHPEWQKGKLNGVGGVMRPGETPVEAMVRKFENETGCKSEPSMWRLFAITTFKEVVLYSLTMRSNVVYQYGSRGEEVIMVNAKDVGGVLLPEVVHDVPYLVPLALHDGVRVARIDAF